MQQKEPKIYYLKVVVLGDENSGKHELFDKLAYLSHFSYTYQTMRCKIGVRSLFLKDEKLGDIIVEIVFWLIASTSIKKSLKAAYYNKSSAAIATFNLSDIKTFFSMQNLVYEFLLLTKKKSPVIIVGVNPGTKTLDLDLSLAGELLASKLSIELGVKIPYLEVNLGNKSSVINIIIDALIDVIFRKHIKVSKGKLSI